jgi:hypothetical protein
MLSGTARVDVLASNAAELTEFARDAVLLSGVEILQVLFESTTAAVSELLPPALHPTVPGLIRWSIQRVPASPWGPFMLAETRLECRSGLRPRALLTAGAIDNEAAGRALTSHWGFRLTPAAVQLERRYDEIRASVIMKEGEPILELVLADPSPLSAHDLQFIASMHLARTPRGVRLVQVDAVFEVTRAERGLPILDSFDAGAWQGPGLKPRHPVSASFCVANVTLPVLRYVCDPDKLAFDGTEQV